MRFAKISLESQAKSGPLEVPATSGVLDWMDSALPQEFPPSLTYYDFISVFRLLTLSVQKAGKFTLANIPDRSLFHAYRKNSKLQTITNPLTWENMGKV